ncbi:hypothetical protein ACWERY_10635 [Streptomyces sp. NPDC004082]
MHQLDASAEDTVLVLDPDQFALSMIQAKQAAVRREKHLADPDSVERS